MIGHDDKGINIHARVVKGQFPPDILHHPAGLVEVQGSVKDLPQQAFPVLRADRHEVGPGLGIVIAFQAK